MNALRKRRRPRRSTLYAAEQVLEIFEKKYPDDKRPRLAIEAARAVLKKDTKINRDAAYAADAAMKLKIIMHGIKLLKSQREVKK